jgi:hypothetical protein
MTTQVKKLAGMINFTVQEGNYDFFVNVKLIL